MAGTKIPASRPTSLTARATLPATLATTWPASLTAARTEFPLTPIAGRQHRGSDRLLDHLAGRECLSGKARVVGGITMDLEHGVPLMPSMVGARLAVGGENAFANDRVGIPPHDLALGRDLDEIADTAGTATFEHRSTEHGSLFC